MITISEQALREIFEGANKATKKKISTTFPDMFLTELKNGLWYKHDGGTLFCHQEGNDVYGFNPDGTWCYSSKGGWTWDKKSTKGVSSASFQEVKDAIIREAKKRGYVIDGYKPLDRSFGSRGFEEDIDSWAFHSNPSIHILYSQKSGRGGDIIFDNGVWAKQKDTVRIEQVKKEIADLQIELEQLDNYFK